MTRPIDPTRMRREIANLSRGAVAALCGSIDQDDVDAYRAAWLEWVEAQPPRRRWRSRQHCHDVFVEHLVSTCQQAGFVVCWPAVEPCAE